MGDIVKRNPFSMLDEIQRDMNRFFENRFYPGVISDSLLANEKNWIPAVDIEEKEDCYLIAVDLPGMNPDDIHVTAHDNMLVIKGQRESKTEDKDKKRSERLFGSFLREFTMPANAALDRISAKSEHGVLEVTVPKAQKSEPKRINVEKS